VQGIGAAIILTGTVSIIRAAFPPERLGWAIGIYFMASAAVVLASPVIGGWLAGAGFWRVTYWIAVAAAVLAWFLLTRIPESRDERAVGKGIDWIGAALSATALIGVSNGFIQAGEAGFGDGTVILSLGIGLVALVAFVIVELRVERPLLDMRLFQKRRFNLFALYALIHTFTISAIGLFLIQNLQSAQGFSPSAAAMATIPLTLMMVLLSGWAGSTSDKLGPRPLLAGGALLGAIGSIWLAFSGVNATPSAYWTKFFPGLVMLGAGMGLIQTPLTRAIVVSGSAKAAGMMSGLNQLLIQSGTVIGVAVFGLIATQVFTAQHAHLLSQFPLNPADQVVVQLPDATQSFREAIAVTYKVVHLVVAALLFVNFLSALFLMKRRISEPAPVSAEMGGDNSLKIASGDRAKS
jgi:MFS family permease